VAGDETRVFVCYRREAADPAGRIADNIEGSFQPGWVFIDARLEVGKDFEQQIQGHLDVAEVLVAVIHPTWADAAGRRRLADPEDWVRREITTALERSVPVLPVLVGGAAPPKAGGLPKPLHALAELTPVALYDDRRQERVAAIVKQLEAHIEAAARRREAAMPPTRGSGGDGLSWRGSVRGDQAQTYDLIAAFMAGSSRFAVRRGDLLGKRPSELVLSQVRNSSFQELVVRLSVGTSGCTDVVMSAGEDQRRRLHRLVKDVLGTRRVVLPAV
jgi:hypothetical protein